MAFENLRTLLDNDLLNKAVETMEPFRHAYPLLGAVHKATLTFPQAEQLGLAEEIRLNARDICTLLAEGVAIQHYRPTSYKETVYEAIGCATRLPVLLHIAKDLGYIDEVMHDQWAEQYHDLEKELKTLFKRIKT